MRKLFFSAAGLSRCGILLAALGLWLASGAVAQAVTVTKVNSTKWTIENTPLKVTIQTNTGMITVRDKTAGYDWVQPGAITHASFTSAAKITGRGVQFWSNFSDPTAGTLPVCLELTLESDTTRQMCLTANITNQATAIAGFDFIEPFTLATSSSYLVAPDFCDGHLYPTDLDAFALWSLDGYYSVNMLDMPWLGVCDLSSGLGYSVIVDTPDDAWVRCPKFSGRRAPQVHWLPQLGKFGVKRSLIYTFTAAGGYVELAKNYRSYIQAKGGLVTLAAKAAVNPNVAKLYGAPLVWDYFNYVDAAQARRDGVGRMLHHVHEWSDASAVSANHALGYLTEEYDSYFDAQPIDANNPLGSYYDLYPDHFARNADGTVRVGWQDAQWSLYRRCPEFYLAAAQAVIPSRLAAMPLSSRYLDVHTSMAIEECYDATHPKTRTQWREDTLELLGYIRSQGQVLSGEHGRGWSVPAVDVMDGVMSSPGWPWESVGRPAAYGGDTTFDSYPVNACYANITVDGQTGEWPAAALAYSDPQSDSGCTLDFKQLWLANDEDYLYLRVDAWASSVAWSTGGVPNLTMFIDTDATTTTGFNAFSYGAVGSELLYALELYSEGDGGYNDGQIGSVTASPVLWPATQQLSWEFKIARTATHPATLGGPLAGQPIFGADFSKIRLLLTTDTSAPHDRMPDAATSGVAIEYMFAANPAKWTAYETWGSLGHAYRVPLWELVYHDCAVAMWYPDDASDCTVLMSGGQWYQDKKDAFNVLYGTPAVFLNIGPDGGWHLDRERFMTSYRNTCKPLEALADKEMVSHSFVTSDRSVQKTIWSDGTVAYVNFGTADYWVTDWTPYSLLKQYDFVVRGPSVQAEKSYIIADATSYTNIALEGYRFSDNQGAAVTTERVNHNLLRVNVEGGTSAVLIDPFELSPYWDLGGTRVWTCNRSTGARTAQVSWTRVGNQIQVGPFAQWTLLEIADGFSKNDFDGDGKADLAMVTPGSPLVWDVALSSGAYAQTIQNPGWGDSAAGDIAMAGDFDGGGLADWAIYRPGTPSLWAIWCRESGQCFYPNWGGATDHPLTGDYDGDGKTDLAVITQASPMIWSVLLSSRDYDTAQPLTNAGWGDGLCNDVPVAGDFDGMGKTDWAIYRPGSPSLWAIWCQETGQTYYPTWGSPGDVPIVGDFDGDGRCDLGVVSPASPMVWSVLLSSLNYDTNQPLVNTGWGDSTWSDVAILGDFDGGGQSDWTIYRPGLALWAIWGREVGPVSYPVFGASTSVPVGFAHQQ